MTLESRVHEVCARSILFRYFRMADNRELTALSTPCPFSEDLRLRLAGWFRQRVNIESSNSFEVGTGTEVVQVNRGLTPGVRPMTSVGC
jgi:hypothetical protein